MASYKVIQDIEAEDKLFGPLTLKQFIFAMIALAMCFVAFRLGIVNPFFALPFLPFIFTLGVLAAPLGGNQSTEVWLLAKLRFYFKPRKRIWDQTGMQELVKITVPKKVEEHLTNNLSQTEVKSRLNALASTIDSRGWVIKNVDINLYAQPSYGVLSGVNDSSDRLVSASSFPQQVPNTDITANDDIFENPLASRLDAQIEQSKEEHQKDAVQHMQKVIQEGNPAITPIEASPAYWFAKQSPSKQPIGHLTPPIAAPIQLPITDSLMPPKTFLTPDITNAQAQAVLDKAKSIPSDKNFHNHRQLNPIKAPLPKAQSPAVTATPAPDILNLAITNDRRVDSLAREAEKSHPEQVGPPNDDFVVVPLR